MSDHRIHWRIDRGAVYATFSCTAPEGAVCRMWCSQNCESYGEAHEGHTEVDQGYCLVAVWMNNDGASAEELYVGKDRPLVSGEIHTIWENDTYVWDYAEVTS